MQDVQEATQAWADTGRCQAGQDYLALIRAKRQEKAEQETTNQKEVHAE
jgi:hypothetical protein